MSIELSHHPYSRSSTVVWMLEEVSAPPEKATRTPTHDRTHPLHH